MSDFTRREFLVTATATAASLSLGCGTPAEGRKPTTSDMADADHDRDTSRDMATGSDARRDEDTGYDADSGADAGAPDDVGADAGAADMLQPTCGDVTPANIEGPFFSPGSPERANIREGVTAGVLLRITGRVLTTDCVPIPNAVLDFWQADDDGEYDNLGYIFRGHQFADRDGRYELETIIPGRYLNGARFRPAHIHVKVGAEQSGLLTTQLYFSGDPFNQSDSFIVPSLIMDIRDSGMDSKAAEFDFVMRPA